LAPVPHRWSAQKLKDELPQMLVEGVKGSAMGGFLSWFSDSYPSFETLFKNNLGEASLKDALKHLLIASYNTLTEKMNIFDSQEESEGDIFLWNLVQASGAISAKMGPEWAWGAVDLRYGPDQISAGWVDSGMAPRDQKISTHEALASILKTKFPDRLIYIYSFSGGPCTFMGSPNNEQRVTQWQDGNINFVRFMPFYDDIPETTFGFSTWYKMLLDTSKENISIIDNHFFVPELLNSEEYKNMFEVIGQRFK
jgi:hypothetical protein